MLLRDDVYGEFEINEPVIIDLLNSKSLKRLRNISSAGYYPYYKNTAHDAINRYYHSVGVFLLLRKFNAPLTEQISGLIHDVSHSAFSHTIDYIESDLENQKQQVTQDENHYKIIYKTDIPCILKKHNFSIEYILDKKNFPLAENELPDICADRIDYFFRHAYLVYKIITEQEKDYILENLTVYNNQFVFKCFTAACLYAERFWHLDEEHWSGLESAVMFGVSGRLFRRAIQKSYFSKQDLFVLTDKEILAIIKKHLPMDKKLKFYVDLLHLPVEKFENNKTDFLAHIFCKSRKVNPLFITTDGLLARVADKDPVFNLKFINSKKYKEYYVHFLSDNKSYACSGLKTTPFKVENGLKNYHMPGAKLIQSA